MFGSLRRNGYLCNINLYYCHGYLQFLSFQRHHGTHHHRHRYGLLPRLSGTIGSYCYMLSHPLPGGISYFCTMKDSTPHLITAAEFNAQVRRWADEIKMMAQASLATGTHGTGRLRDRFAAFVDATRHTDPNVDGQGEAPAYKVKFGFDRYGVFRAYGVGRGWVRVDGVLTRGFTERNKKKAESTIAELLHMGYKRSELKGWKFREQTDTGRERTPLDWLDQHINRRINELADHVQEFYGDAAMRILLDEIGKIRIVKKGGSVGLG